MTSSGTTSGIPLDEYRKDIPPGWAPGDSRYTLKQYMERVKVWYRLFDGPDENVGPLLAGRLRGRAQQIALSLRLPDPTGHVDVGDAALVRLSVDEVTDPAGNIIQRAIPSGPQALLHALRAAFGEAEQLQATKALETFFEFRRGRLPISEWSVQWELNLEEAVLHAGLEVNPVAKTYLFFKSSGLPQKTIDDLLLQVHGDMRRFEEVRTLLLRMAHRGMDAAASSNLYEDTNKAFYQDDIDSSSWSNITEPWNEEWPSYETDELYAWYEGWYDDDASWYYDQEEPYEHGDWQETWYEAGEEEPADQAEGEPAEQSGNVEESFYKGKGKSRSSTMGLGCSTCGSKWHNTHSCPLNDQKPHKGKGRGKGFGKSKSKGYGKSYGKPYNKGFGKSKGFGKKGKPFARKGYGKRGFWAEELPTGFQDYYGGSYLMNLKTEIDEQPTSKGFSTPTSSMPRIVKIDTPDREELLIGKKVRFEEKAPDDDEATEKNAKKLNFPSFQDQKLENFHMVRGRKVFGLLVDPGAASGLIGTDTLRELLDAGMVPEHLQDKITWEPSTTTVTGISGQGDSTLARVCLPFGVGGEDGIPASYTAELIGGQGSTCPALLPNVSLRQMRSAMMTQWFDNGDGILVCSTNGQRLDHPDAHLTIMRLLLTESGHYILPVSNNQNEAEIPNDEVQKIKQIWQNKPYQATTLEQTCNDLHNDDNKSDGKIHNKEKLQFMAEDNKPIGPKNNVMDKADKPPDEVQLHQQHVAEDEPPIQVLLGNGYNQEYDEGKCDYPGDIFPGHLPEGKLRYLQKMYKGVPEEFYTKTRQTPVTPKNARSWMKKRKGNRFNLWEWCSGSGRLSLIALLSGLCVLFPIDYRYGWDLSLPEHQRLILEIEQDINHGPDVLFASPTCRPWSISSTRRDLAQTMREREGELPTVSFIKQKIKKRCKDKKGNILEQPWTSALWEHLEDLPGERQRTDQCRFGAQDELGQPILKPTGLYSDFGLRNCLARCGGHQGRRHGWLQGTTQGVNRTTIAAVYPEAFCKSVVRDIKRFINQIHCHDVYYKCEKCAMGRAATSNMEHTFLPGECRYGKWPAGEDPREKKRLEREQQAKDDIFDSFRKESLKNPKVMQGKLSSHPTLAFDSEQTAVLKMCLIKLLSESIEKFEVLEKKKGDQNYTHWLEDPAALGWLQRIFKDYMMVQGAMACLQPWSTPTPSPQLAVEEAPIRLLLRGNVNSWKISQPEDLRELSLSQWNEPINIEEDWLVAIFGSDAPDKGSSSSSSTRAAGGFKDAKDLIPDDQSEGYEPSIAPDELLPVQPPEVEEEEQDGAAQNPGSLKPLFDFRRVFKRLPQLAGHDDQTAKRLILGLHERLWHAPYMDIKNVLVRCGMPYEVWKLAADAISTCRICRKFTRAGRRPQYKGTNLSQHFNDTVQVDLFKYEDEWYLLSIDETTRYKIATRCESRELKHILDALMRSWIRYFGPMRTLVSDQETALMTVAAGVELQRLNIARQPGGTTSGLQGQKHTSTGLVEKHTDLLKLTMAKIQAEAGRWGIEVRGEELASEASMAANTTFNVGGYSPVTMLFGILPRGYMDPEEQMHDDSMSPNESAFERAVQLRQIALQASQAAILESRIARANRSRPQRLPVENMVPGTTKVEIFRDDGGGFGWRGPATVLKINEGAGTAIVEFQGRPYLAGLRHLRPFRDSYMVFMSETTSTTSQDAERALCRMKKVVEQCTPYRPYTMGEVMKVENHETKVIKFPREESPAATQMLKDARAFLDFHYDRVTLHGVRYGKGMKTIMVPRYSKGTLITWSEGLLGIAVVEHNTDSHIHVKELFNKEIDKLCHLYLYGFVNLETEENSIPMRISRRVVPEALQPGEDQGEAMSTSSPTSLDHEADAADESHKRKDPDSRTVVIAPEKKKQRTDLHMLYMSSIWWMMQRPRRVRLPAHEIWYEQEIRWMRKRQLAMTTSGPQRPLFHWHCRTDAEMLVYLQTGEMYRVDEVTDVLTEEQLLHHWDSFEVSDRSEMKQFVDEGIFKKVRLDSLPKEVVLVDGTWVRKFKRNPDNSLKAKSRLCARGFLDSQKTELPTRSTTATRLSQRLFLSTAATHRFKVRSWDVSGAFLKGFSFKKVKEELGKKGISSPDRRVVLIPPANCWRHLAHYDKQFMLAEEELGEYGLECLKPAYGLVDAPLAWQMSLHGTLRDSGGIQSLLDENMWFWKSNQGLTAVLTTHVDDIACAGTDQFLTEEYAYLTKKFGKLSEQKPPFQHCGCRYREIKDGYAMDQQEFINNMKPLDLSHLGKDMSRALTPTETTLLRSVLGGLLWITATRLDLVADVGVLQSKVTRATVQDLYLANSVVKKAKMSQYDEIGIVYRYIPTSSPWRLVAVHDASAASKDKIYSQEGIFILLMEDHLNFDKKVHTINGLNVKESHFGGDAHILFAHGGKAKRVSYSTSHSETLAAMSGLETASLVSLRLAELLSPVRKPTLQQLAALQERGVPFLPVDAMTDCKDFYSLTTGMSSLPQDKSQRIYVLAHREARLCGRLRWIILVPTQSMVADALTKVMLSKQLLHLMSCGQVVFMNEPKHPIEARRLPPCGELSEDDLLDGDEKWLTKEMTSNEILAVQRHTTSRSMTSSRSSTPTTRSNYMLLALLCAVSWTSGKAEDQCEPDGHGESSGELNAQKVAIFFLTTFCMMAAYAIFALWKCLKRMDERFEAETAQAVRSLTRANLVDRLLQTEHNVMELQIQLNESLRDIDILYRTLRRRAGPHPEEPSPNRPRIADNRPALPEPEGEFIEREFNETASRSRDETASRSRDEDDSREEIDEDVLNEYIYPGQLQQWSIEEITSDMEEHERRDARMRNRIHIMSIEGNNMEVYLHVQMQRYGFPVPLSDILVLYELHAPSIPAPGDYQGSDELFLVTTRPDGVLRHLLRERSDTYGDYELEFDTQMGLFSFRNRRIITREDTRLTEAEREERITNLYNNFRHFTS